MIQSYYGILSIDDSYYVVNDIQLVWYYWLTHFLMAELFNDKTHTVHVSSAC